MNVSNLNGTRYFFKGSNKFLFLSCNVFCFSFEIIFVCFLKIYIRVFFNRDSIEIKRNK